MEHPPNFLLPESQFRNSLLLPKGEHFSVNWINIYLDQWLSRPADNEQTDRCVLCHWSGCDIEHGILSSVNSLTATLSKWDIVCYISTETHVYGHPCAQAQPFGDCRSSVSSVGVHVAPNDHHISYLAGWTVVNESTNEARPGERRQANQPTVRFVTKFFFPRVCELLERSLRWPLWEKG